MKKQPLVSIIILGWNNYDDVINCLDSLNKIDYANYTIVLVDNNSQDDAFQKLLEWLEQKPSKYQILSADKDDLSSLKSLKQKLTVIKSEKNLGFTGGNNLACKVILKSSDPEYILALNGDTIVTKSFLTNLVEVCENDQKIGSAQSVLLRFDKKTVDSLGLKMQGRTTFDDRGGENKKILSEFGCCDEIFGACGAAALYRADIIRKIGLFDEALFATYEDFDLAWRVRLAGFKTILVKNSVVYHRGGISRTSKGHKRFDLRSYYAARNILVVYGRYYPIRVDILLNSIVWFGVGIISAFKNGKTKDFISVIFNFSKERRAIRKNKLIQEIQQEWMK